MPSFNSHAYGQMEARVRLERWRTTMEQRFQRDIKDHRFKVFRLGFDICATCQKPRKEHEVSL